MDLSKSMRISAAGLEAQSARMRTIAENLANADSLPQEPGADPYRRKMLTFKNELDRATGAKEKVEAEGLEYRWLFGLDDLGLS